MIAHEPSSLYYAIPRFSQQHPAAIGHIQLMSGKFWHFALVLIGVTILTFGAYQLLADWSQTGAIVAATFILYGAIMSIANYGLSKHYSLYGQGDKLVFNNSWWGMLVVDYADIDDCMAGQRLISGDPQALVFGGAAANLQIVFKRPQSYFSGFGNIVEKHDSIYLNVSNKVQV